MKRFLITGVKGQIGTKLLPRLLSQFGKDNVIATDVGDFLDMGDLDSSVNYFKLDVTDRDRLEYIISNEKITNVVHLAGILSALSERKPELAKEVNIDSVHYLFRASLKYNLRYIFLIQSLYSFNNWSFWT